MYLCTNYMRNTLQRNRPLVIDKTKPSALGEFMGKWRKVKSKELIKEGLLGRWWRRELEPPSSHLHTESTPTLKVAHREEELRTE